MEGMEGVCANETVDEGIVVCVAEPFREERL